MDGFHGLTHSLTPKLPSYRNQSVDLLINWLVSISWELWHLIVKHEFLVLLLHLFYLTYFMLLVSFHNRLKHHKKSGFPMFPGGIERDHLHEMDWKFLHRERVPGDFIKVSGKLLKGTLMQIWKSPDMFLFT